MIFVLRFVDVFILALQVSCSAGANITIVHEVLLHDLCNLLLDK